MIKSKYETQIPKMIELRKSGMKLKDISLEMNIPIETIRNLLHKNNGWIDIPDKQNKEFDYKLSGLIETGKNFVNQTNRKFDNNELKLSELQNAKYDNNMTSNAYDTVYNDMILRII
jgi:hypothetical protein